MQEKSIFSVSSDFLTIFKISFKNLFVVCLCSLMRLWYISLIVSSSFAFCNPFVLIPLKLRASVKIAKPVSAKCPLWK